MLKNKMGTILVENVIFIILNILFIGILILFVARQASGAIVLEQNYAKQIALLIDSAKPGATFQLNMDNAHRVALKNSFPFDRVVDIDNDNHLVRIKISKDSEYVYSFFHDVFVTSYVGTKPDTYVFTLSKK